MTCKWNNIILAICTIIQDGKTFLDDYKTWADFADVDITQFHSTADWNKPYMVPNEDGQMVESGQTVGEYLRDELKEIKLVLDELRLE